MLSLSLLVLGTVLIAIFMVVATRRHPHKWWLQQLLAFILLIGAVCEGLAGLFILNKEAYFLAIVGPFISIAFAVFIGRNIGQTATRQK